MLFRSLLDPIRPAALRLLVRFQRHYLWLRDPFGKNHFLDRFLDETRDADLVVANGDFACDTAYLGVSDDAAFQSARECLGQLRGQFGDRFHGTFGDHEIGKKMMGADAGGPRLASYHRAEQELGLRPFWQRTVGRHVLMGVASTLVAWSVYGREALPEEAEEWERLRAGHLAAIRAAFAALAPGQRVLLFCHDPTALPFLWREPAVREKLPRIERTILGHLHSPKLLALSRALAGLPEMGFLGHTVLRWTAALREARHWAAFRPLLCPSPSGLELFKDGGFYTAELEPDGEGPVPFRFHPLPW